LTFMSNLLILETANEAAALNWTLTGQVKDADVVWDSAFTDGYTLEAGLKWVGEGEGSYAACVEALDSDLAQFDDASHPVICHVLQMSGEDATGVSVHSLSVEQWANTGNAIEGPVIAGATITDKWSQPAEEDYEEEIVVDEA